MRIWFWSFSSVQQTRSSQLFTMIIYKNNKNTVDTVIVDFMTAVRTSCGYSVRALVRNYNFAATRSGLARVAYRLSAFRPEPLLSTCTKRGDLCADGHFNCIAINVVQRARTWRTPMRILWVTRGALRPAVAVTDCGLPDAHGVSWPVRLILDANAADRIADERPMQMRASEVLGSPRKILVGRHRINTHPVTMAGSAYTWAQTLDVTAVVRSRSFHLRRKRYVRNRRRGCPLLKTCFYSFIAI